MRFIVIKCIKFYQRFLSSRKGYSCAHHRLHGGHTCSNAVKEIILENGFFSSISKTKLRFQACRTASVSLANRADLPCDLPCDVSSGCGDEEDVCDIISLPLEFCGSSERRSGKSSRLKRNVFWAVMILLAIVFSYYFYGRGISTIYVTPQSEKSFFSSKVWQRKTPDLRIKVEVNGEKIYSEIINDVDISVSNKALKFNLKQTIFDFPDSLEVQDARVKIGGDLLVAAEVLEKVSRPKGIVERSKFRYKVKRRWHF